MTEIRKIEIKYCCMETSREQPATHELFVSGRARLVCKKCLWELGEKIKEALR